MENLNLLKLRAKHANNDRQHDRMVKDKLRSLHRALLYSYQTAWIKKDGVEDADYVRALINPDKVKFDYDEKIVSVEYEHGFEPGDTFECSYALEYGTATVEVQKSDVQKGQKFLVIDDLIATGGTLSATKNLIEQGGGEVTDFFGVIGLPELNYEKVLAPCKVTTLINYAGA